VILYSAAYIEVTTMNACRCSGDERFILTPGCARGLASCDYIDVMISQDKAKNTIEVWCSEP